MAYNITLTNGTNLVTVADGTTETNYTSLTLIGKNFAGYGAFLNENFIKLLENFSSSSPPPNSLQGQIWWDSTNKVLKVLSGTTWKTVSSSTSSTTVPSNPSTGDLWWDTANGQLKVYGGSTWVVIGPAYTATQGQTGVIADVVSESGGAQSHIIVKVFVNNSIIAVLSKDASFPVTSLTGFSVINPGFNLASGAGINYGYYGDANNALNLGGVPAASYMRGDQQTSTTFPFSVQNSTGLSVGVASDFRVGVTTTAVNLSSEAAGKDLAMYANVGGIAKKLLVLNGASGEVTLSADPVTLLGVATKQYVDNTLAGSASLVLKRDGTNTISGIIAPNTNGTLNFGSASATFNNIYATNFVGTASDSQRLNNILAANYARTDIPVAFQSNVTIGSGSEFTINSTSAPNSVNLKGNTPNKNLTISVNVGGTQTNAITIAGTTGLATVLADPSSLLGIATKQYVDNTVVNAGSAINLTSVSSNIIPANSTYNIGSSATKWANVYATTFTGNVTGSAATAVTVTGNAQPAITSVGTLANLTVNGSLASGGLTATGLTDSGNLTFTGTGNFIRGDFSNNTYSSRVLVQSSALNGPTSFGTVPNGASTLSGFVAYASTAVNNSSIASLYSDGTYAYCSSEATGSGTLLPLVIKVGGANRYQFGTAGEIGIGGATYGAPGQVLTSGGSGAPCTWSTVSSSSGSAQSAGSLTAGYVNYTGASAAAGQFDGGTTAPSGTSRLNYGGYLYATKFYGDGSSLVNISSLNATSNFQSGGLGVGSIGGVPVTGVANEVRAAGNITAYFASDLRLKQNIVPIANALDKVNQISGNEFDWTQSYIDTRGGVDGYFVRSHDVGVIAQEVEAVLPEAVAEREDGFKGVNYEKLVPLLIQAVKELSAEVAALKAAAK